MYDYNIQENIEQNLLESSDEDTDEDSENILSENESFESEEENELEDQMIEQWMESEDLEEIVEWEEEILPYKECIPDHYYIGTYKLLPQQNILFFAKKIHLSTFYKYSHKTICEYLYWYSGIYISENPRLEIMQLKVDPSGIYSCVIKTYWIKIIQRTWKRVFKEEQQKITQIKKNILSILQNIQRTGKPIFKTKLHGLLSIYQT